jgi:VIT1/CCC1 family predicted Fe2+/Mn2+ transporter
VNTDYLKTGFAMSKPEKQETKHRWQTVARVAGVLIAAPFFLWFFLGLLGLVPSIVQVFGPAEVRTPAAIVVAGLLIAALGFWDD